MKNYDNCDNYRKRVHTVRITFQSDEYKGHIAYKVGGNCKGAEILEWYPECVNQEDVDRYVENDCEFKLIDDGAYFSLKLKSDAGEFHTIETTEGASVDIKLKDGDSLILECADDEIKEYVVCLEIIDCEVSD